MTSGGTTETGPKARRTDPWHVRIGIGTLVVTGLAWLLLVGGRLPSSLTELLGRIGLGIACVAVVCGVARGWRTAALPTGIAIATAGHAVIGAEWAGLMWPFQPVDALAYLVIAAVGAFGRRLTLFVALVMSWSVVLVDGASANTWRWADIEWVSVVSQMGMLGAFGLFGRAAVGAEIARQRRRHRTEIEEHRDELLREAREYRLLSAGRGIDDHRPGERSELSLVDAVEAVQRAIYESLRLLHRALGATTVILVWRDVQAESLRIRELVSDRDDIVEGPLKPTQGVFGSIQRSRDSVCLSDLRPGFRGLTYYSGDPDVQTFVGVPLLEEGHLRGMLAVDRQEEPNFDEDDVTLVEEVAEHIRRTIERERLFRSVEETKFELGQFFEASRRLNDVLSMESVLDAALESARDVVEWDMAAVTTYDRQADAHRIERLEAAESVGIDLDAWTGREFDSNQGWVSMAVENEHYLPFGGKVRDGPSVVFDGDEDLGALQSVLVLPLTARDQPIGTLVVAARRPEAFGSQHREMLEVISHQVAVSLQNARLFRQMEELATTDGLTGLPNHRSFQSRIDEAMQRHHRTEQPLGLLLLDIDHFKHVNDTYGHPVGDEVLKEVAEAIRESVRDVEEAEVVAERIRRSVEALEFTHEGETFGCTVSIGLGIWPVDASSKRELIDATDQALYVAKERGRNQVTAVRHHSAT